MPPPWTAVACLPPAAFWQDRKLRLRAKVAHAGAMGESVAAQGGRARVLLEARRPGASAGKPPLVVDVVAEGGEGPHVEDDGSTGDGHLQGGDHVREEGREQLPDTVHLQHEAAERPAQDDQQDSGEIRGAALPLLAAEEELEGLGGTKQQAEAHEERDVPECKEGALKEKAAAQDDAHQADDTEANADLLVVVEHRSPGLQ
mmetsp:Transcript_66331/g.148891  ORF Transcript_66331/g.148891 Transcript_66331/m.148891 type:complete len:202 (+) Transcript_66331:49-654(+)